MMVSSSAQIDHKVKIITIFILFISNFLKIMPLFSVFII